MGKLIKIACVALLMLTGSANGQEGTYGIGGFFNLYVPLFNFRDMYGNGTKYGATIHYTYHKRKSVEVEFHHASFNDGSLETRRFRFSDGKDYISPQAESKMTFNSVSANWLFALKAEGFGQGVTPYLTFGTGLYDYSSKVSGLIYAAQIPTGPNAPPNTSLLQEPINDTRTSFSTNFGGGLQFGLGGKAALDLRVRYNIVMGELRPFLVWDVEKTFPFNLIDLGVGIKFNIN